MQSKSFFLLRRILPASPSNNSSDDDPIGGAADIAMSAIETSLIVLKEASALTSKVPYFAPIAGIILEALKMRDEVKQLKQEWGVVMQKLAKVGSILIDVGEWYQTNDMSEDDLPSDLRNVLKSLQTDLDGIQGVMEECAKVKGIRKILLRTDILGKVKKYDANLTDALQVFQARVALGNRLAQIIQERNAKSVSQTAADGAGSTQFAEPLAPTPSAPQMFFGRDAELAQIIEMIFAKNESRAARIAILGPGGYGKTTLAHAALTHPRVREHYGDPRYILKCESLLSSGALMIQLAKTLGVLKAGSDASWSRIRESLIAKQCIICFDNFESPWDQPGDIKVSSEDLLSRITEIHHVTVIITMRGTERPAGTQWTRPTLAPLRTLNWDAAKVVWEHIADHYDDFAEKLIKAVDCVPLAVNLLAHLAQAISPASLWQEWNEKHIQLIQRPHTNSYQLIVKG
ncbi:P-loop containing nucleoside triphosphate hydrolase protein [Lactarius quietus]|nr:P-loop containing nucleoside triphosphate hydrolase protein [Lactarius quietus]